MFLRLHRVGSIEYHEVLESFRDQATGRSKHRCVARWDAGIGLNDIQGALQYAKRMRRSARADLHRAEDQIANNPPPLGETTHPNIERWKRELKQARRREAKATRFLNQLIEAEAGLARSGKASARVTTTQEAPLTEMEEGGRRWRVRKLEREGFATGWIVEWFGPPPVDPVGPADWRQVGSQHRTRREAAAMMGQHALVGVVRH